MKRTKTIYPILILLVLVLAASGCGSGGGGAAPVAEAAAPVPASALTWEPPTTFADNTPMDPVKDLDHYEIYVGTSPVFTDNDVPVAHVAALTFVDEPSGNAKKQVLTSSFMLNNLLPFVEPGNVYFVSIRAVGVDALTSGFSRPLEWDLG